MHVTTPMMQLQDPTQTKVVIVTLAETTPVLEAAALQADLERAGIAPWAWVINNSLAAAHTASPLLRRRAAHELAQIHRVRDQHAHRLALVPVQHCETVGLTALAELAAPRPVLAAR
jgi:arsenite-transporting ATPase